MDTAVTQVITSYGGLGVLALFAWLLLRSVLKRQDSSQEEFIKQLTLLVERQEKQNKIIDAMLDMNKQHETNALDRHTKIVECLNTLNNTCASRTEKIIDKVEKVVELTLEKNTV